MAYFQLIECSTKIVQRFDLQKIVRADDGLAVLFRRTQTATLRLSCGT
jgi:hypothetical protein